MFQFEGLNYRYPGAEEKSLCDLSLRIGKGEFVLLCGGSGSGKTTLTRCLNGLIPRFFEGEFSGAGTIGGEDFAHLDVHHIAEKAGSVFQDPRSQFFTTDVTSELAFGLENYGVEPDEMRRRVAEAAALLGIENLLGRNLFKLSSGEKQKVAIASALTLRPAALILDEPSANLDPAAVEELRRLLFKLKEKGYTVVISEHRFFFLNGLIDRVLRFDNGALCEEIGGADFFRFSDTDAAERGLRFPGFSAGGIVLPSAKPTLDALGIGGARSGRPQGDGTPAEPDPAGGTPKDAWASRKLQVSDQPKKSETALSLENISFAYGKKKILDGFSLAVYTGEIVALTGNNGAGKTTLLRIIAGLVKEKSGRIFIKEKAVRAKRWRRGTFVMQDADYQLFTESVLRELLLGNEKEESIDIKAEQALKHFGLYELRERHPSSLSGGEKQRLTMALAMVNNSDFVLMDEPTSGLDRRNMERVSAMIGDLAGQGKAVIVVTHDREFIERCCHREVVMKSLTANTHE